MKYGWGGDLALDPAPDLWLTGSVPVGSRGASSIPFKVQPSRLVLHFVSLLVVHQPPWTDICSPHISVIQLHHRDPGREYVRLGAGLKEPFDVIALTQHIGRSVPACDEAIWTL